MRGVHFTIQWEIQSPTGMALTPFDGASPLLKIQMNIRGDLFGRPVAFSVLFYQFADF